MGACTSRNQIAQDPPDPNDIERQLKLAIHDYRYLKHVIRRNEPYYLTTEFVHTMNERRAAINGLLNRIELERPSQAKMFFTYYEDIDTRFKDEIRERFRDGRIRVAATVTRIPSVVDLIMPGIKKGAERAGSALY